MNISETNGKETIPHSNELLNLITAIDLLRAFKRPFTYAHIDIKIVEDLPCYYDVARDKTRFTIRIKKPHKEIRFVYPLIAFAWATILTWDTEEEEPYSQFTPEWGKRVAECWRITQGEYTGRTEDEFRSKFE